jgi:hypothetical protein
MRIGETEMTGNGQARERNAPMNQSASHYRENDLIVYDGPHYGNDYHNESQNNQHRPLNNFQGGVNRFGGEQPSYHEQMPMAYHEPMDAGHIPLNDSLNMSNAGVRNLPGENLAGSHLYTGSVQNIDAEQRKVNFSAYVLIINAVLLTILCVLTWIIWERDHMDNMLAVGVVLVFEV